jgi:hypothetical protein
MSELDQVKPLRGLFLSVDRVAWSRASAPLAIPVAFITPPSWKRAVSIQPGKDGAKDAARGEAIRRWPAHAAMFARKKDDGRAEACLIAVAGLLREGGRHG